MMYGKNKDWSPLTSQNCIAMDLANKQLVNFTMPSQYASICSL